MKHLRKILLSVLFSLFVVYTVAFSEYLPDIIVTSPNGIWTDTRAYATLADAITAIGANEREIYIARQETLTTATVPSNAHLKFSPYGSIANSSTLTIQSKDISASNHQIFTGSGAVDFATGSAIRSTWFQNIESAFAQTSNDTVTLIIADSHTITASYSPGNNITLKWEAPGNILTINAGRVCGNLKNIEAGDYQIFAGSGDFDFLDGTILKSSWFNRIRSIVNWVGSDEVTLIISKYEQVDYTETTPNNISIILPIGEEIEVTAGDTLTINGSLDLQGMLSGAGNITLSGKFTAPLRQVFDVTGTLTISRGAVDYIYPDYFTTNTTPGTTDMTTAINAAWAAYEDIKISSENYLISAPIEFDSINSITGSGAHSTITASHAGAMLQSASGDDEIFVYIKDLSLDGGSVATIGIDFRGISNSLIENVFISNSTTGIRMTCAGTLSAVAQSATYNRVVNTRITNGTTGILIGTDVGSTGSYCNANEHTSLEISTMSDDGVSIYLADKLTFTDGTIEGITSQGIDIDSGNRIDVRGVYFDFMSNYSVTVDTNSEGCSIQSCAIPDQLKKIYDAADDTIIDVQYYSTKNAVLNNTGPELITNGSFTSDVSSWTTGGTSVAGGVSGNCLALTDLAATATQSLSIREGRFYRWEAWVKTGTSGNEAFRIYYGPTSDTAYLTGTSSATWTRYFMVFKAETSENIFTLKKQGAGVGTMLFDEVSVVELPSSNAGRSVVVAGQVGGVQFGYENVTGTPNGTTTYFDILTRVPLGAVIIGANLRVETALTAGETWSAAYNGGASQSIAAAGRAVAKDTRITQMYDANANTAITTGYTNIRITRDAGNFTDGVGVIRGEVYYMHFIPLATTP